MRSKLELVDDWEERAEAAGYNASQMALKIGITLRQLEKFFHEQFKMGPHDWMVRLRMTRAAALLIIGKPVRIVSAKVGYKQVSHFSREFKSYFGIPPGRYALTQIKASREQKAPGNSDSDKTFCTW